MKTIARLVAASLVLLATLLLMTLSARTDDKRPALPASVSSASTVFVENQTTSAQLLYTAYIAISKWGRFQIVDTPKKADIVLCLSGGSSVKLVSGERQASTPEPAKTEPKAVKQIVTAAPDIAVPAGSTRISLIDPKTGNSLWSDIRKTDSPRVATHMLDGLREAFDHQK